MSPSAEIISVLRIAGKLQEALTALPPLLAEHNKDLPLHQEAADVYFALMQECHEKNDTSGAAEYYHKYQALELPEEEVARHEQFKLLYRRQFPEYHRMQEANKLSKSGQHLEALAIYESILTTLPDLSVAFVNVGWCIYRLLADMAPKPEADVPLVQKCFAIYSQFDIHGPSNLHSQMLRIALYFKDTKEIPVLEFIDGWNFDNFRDEDLEPFRANGGTTIPSLRERAFLTFSKLLLEGLRSPEEAERDRVMVYAKSFLPILEDTLPELPRNVWLPYSRALLLAVMGKRNQAKTELLIYLRARTNEFWAWAALAEIYLGEDDAAALACFCKAMLLPAQGELALFVSENLTTLLVRYELYNEAKTEIEHILEARKKKQWKISPELISWCESTWFAESRAFAVNKSFYIRNLPKAEAVLWADIPDNVAIVTHIDKAKGFFYYAVDRTIGGKAMIKGAASRLKVGDILALKLKEMETAGNKWYKILSLRLEPERIPEEITQFLEEYIQIPRGRDFGFLKPSNTYVGPEVIRQYDILDGQKISGIALLSFNKQKNDWGWKLLAVDQ